MAKLTFKHELLLAILLTVLQKRQKAFSFQLPENSSRYPLDSLIDIRYLIPDGKSFLVESWSLTVGHVLSTKLP